MNIFGNLLDFLYPKPEDVLSLESMTAADLVSKLPPAPDLGEHTLAIWSYTDERVRKLVWELKYRRNSLVAKHLAQVLYDILRTELAERALFESAGWRIHPPLLVPVPQSHKRRLEKGFNQTQVLCEEVEKLDTERLFEYAQHILVKERHTSSQTLTANKRQRLANVENSMKALALSGVEGVEGRNIVVIDDVTTTGATFKEAVRALKVAGAKRVLCIAVAH